MATKNKYEDMSVLDALKYVKNRNMLLPDIQREYVWTYPEIEKLFESVVDGYPVGSCIMWRTSRNNLNKEKPNLYYFLREYIQDKSKNEKAPEYFNEETDYYIVLDGQQRITSLNIALYGSFTSFKGGRGHAWDNPKSWITRELYYNLDYYNGDEDDDENPKKRFAFMTEDDSKIGNWYKVKQLLAFDDGDSYLEGLMNAGYKKESRHDLYILFNRLHDSSSSGLIHYYTYYSFSIEPEKLLKIGYVLHRSEAQQNMMPTYQRIIKKKRLQEVRNFINNGGYFPNSIIICIDTNGKGLVFDQSPTKIEGTISKIGVLHIPKRYRSAYIIDGQHRLYGYSDSDYASNNSIPVVAFVDLERTEQIKIFMDINENKKAVPKSLRVTLNADMLWDSEDFSEQRQALRSKIAQMLGEEPTSPLHSRVVIGESETTPDRCITVEAIQSALKKCHFFDSYGKKNALQKSGTFDCGNNQETCDLFYPFIEKCLLYIRDKSLNEWDKGDRDNGMLTMNRGIQAIIRVIDDIVNMLVVKGIISPKTQDINDMFSLIEYYLKPLTEYLNALTPEHRKNLRGYFGGGADTRFWRAYQKAIADSRPDFNPDGLTEYWQNESKEYNDETKTMLNELESKIKLVVSSRLEEHYGESWLIKGLPKNIYTTAKKEADEAIYENVANDGDEIDIPIWNYVSLSDCKQIITNGRNWSLLFEDTFMRPEEEKISGGKDAKTDWINRLNSIATRLQNDKYSVPVDEYSFIKKVYDWFMGILIS